jgi:IS5 family transposase
MKTDGKLDKNWLKGVPGDAINAVPCAAGCNLRMILRKLRRFCILVLVELLAQPRCGFRLNTVNGVVAGNELLRPDYFVAAVTTTSISFSGEARRAPTVARGGV